MAARNEKVIVELSTQDRNLLKDIRDALLAIGIQPQDQEEATDTVRRLVESTTVTAEIHPDPALMESHFEMHAQGKVWNGTGWVPKRQSLGSRLGDELPEV